MKRLAACCLSLLMLVGGLVPNNDLSELAKLPDLMQHYRYHHSAAGGALTFGEFLADHYGAGEKQHFGCTFSAWHQQDHHNLPLHNLRGSTWVGFVVAPPVRLRLTAPGAGGAAAYAAAAAALYQFGPGREWLQPPRA